jgi:NAD(P)H-flavin reductase
MVGDKTVVISFDVSEALAHMLNKVGSFVFLRRKDDDQFYHFPVGVMSVDHTSITVAIEAVGTKSKRLLEDISAEIVVRGPYYNGMFGQPWLTTIRGESVLLVAGGIGQAPLLPVARELVQGENRITAILAGGKVGVIFVGEELREMGIDVIEVSSLRQEGMPLLRKKLKKGVDFIASCGSDNQHCGIISVLHEMKLDLPMAATNNAVMCCGEGICGSCHHKMKDGRVVKLCKVQADFRELEQD